MVEYSQYLGSDDVAEYSWENAAVAMEVGHDRLEEAIHAPGRLGLAMSDSMADPHSRSLQRIHHQRKVPEALDYTYQIVI